MPRHPSKRQVAMHLLETSPYIKVLVDTRVKGVVLPKQYAGQTEVMLMFGNVGIPMPDLQLDKYAIRATLMFHSEGEVWCKVPWKAISAVAGQDGKGYIWDDKLAKEAAV